MKQYDAIDWQAFSQKKNIEEIVKNTRDDHQLRLTATIEIALSVISIGADNTLIPQCYIVWINTFTCIIAVIPLVWLAYKYIKRYKANHRTGKDIPNTDDMINLFDNDICYYVLMAESYTQKIRGILHNDVSEVEKFYFLETCFYINKAIYNLSRISNVIEKVFSGNKNKLYEERNISVTRLINVFSILDNCNAIIADNFELIRDIDVNDNYYDLWNKNLKAYRAFKKLTVKLIPEIDDMVKIE